MRTSVSTLAASMTLLQVAATSARAGEVSTPLVSRSDAQNHGLSCSVVNLGKKAIGPITIRIIDEHGDAARELIVSTVEPGHPRALVASDAQLFGLLGYCQVEGKGVSRRTTPVTLCVIPALDFNCLAAVTSP